MAVIQEFKVSKQVIKISAGILPKIHRGRIVIRFFQEQEEANETSKKHRLRKSIRDELGKEIWVQIM